MSAKGINVNVSAFIQELTDALLCFSVLSDALKQTFQVMKTAAENVNNDNCFLFSKDCYCLHGSMLKYYLSYLKNCCTEMNENLWLLENFVDVIK